MKLRMVCVVPSSAGCRCHLEHGLKYNAMCGNCKSLQTGVLVMSDVSESDDVDTKGEQLVRAVFAPMRSQLKRDRPLYGYNFSPPSTPNGNHTILERAQLRTAMAECIQEDDAYANKMLSPPTCNYHKPPRTSPDTPLVRPTPRTVSDVKFDSVSEPDSGYTDGKPPDYTNDDDVSTFTPRCLMRRTFADQKMLIHKSLEVTDSDWLLLVSYLSPPCRKPPLIPGDFPLHTMPHLAVNMKSSKSPCVHSCRCIACAGVKAEPNNTPCLVCGSLIPYSLCMKKTNAQSPLPTMCFACRCAFE